MFYDSTYMNLHDKICHLPAVDKFLDIEIKSTGYQGTGEAGEEALVTGNTVPG